MLFSRLPGLFGRAALFFGLTTLAALGLVGGRPAQAQISGFGSGSGFTLNHATPGLGDSGDGGNPATIANGILTITDTNPSEANSAIFGVKQNITNFTASFIYQDASAVGTTVGGNGFTFFIENSPQGVNALGGRGNGLGYGSDDSPNRHPNYIANSAAIAFNIVATGPGITFVTAGSSGTAVGGSFAATTPVNIASGNPILVSLSYDGTTLTQTLKDMTTTLTFTTSNVTNLVNVVGGKTAFVGFSGGTGGFSALQKISNFTFTPINPAPEPSQTASLCLGALGLFGLMLKARRRNGHTAA